MDSEDKQVLRAIYRKVTKVETLLEGPDGEVEKGVLFRLVTLEHFHGSFRKVFWLVVGGLTTPTAIGAIIWYLISEHKK